MGRHLEGGQGVEGAYLTYGPYECFTQNCSDFSCHFCPLRGTMAYEEVLAVLGIV